MACTKAIEISHSGRLLIAFPLHVDNTWTTCLGFMIPPGSIFKLIEEEPIAHADQNNN